LGSDPDFQPPRPSASAILGSWVVLPEPVSPQTMITDHANGLGELLQEAKTWAMAVHESAGLKANS
jgi:hypothetical protein